MGMAPNEYPIACILFRDGGWSSSASVCDDRSHWRGMPEIVGLKLDLPA